MKQIIITVIILLTLSTIATPAIPGIPIKDDEYAHLFFGYAVAYTMQDKGFSPLDATVTILAISLLKELLDQPRTGFSPTDIGYTMSGATFSILIKEF